MIDYIRVRAFVRATEDPKKVKKAIWNLLGKIPLEEEEVKGVLGNRIIILRGMVKGRKARDAWERLRELLGKQVEAILKDVEKYIDAFGVLHLRLNKQEAYLGRAILGGKGVIKVEIKLRAFPATPEGFLKSAREILS